MQAIDQKQVSNGSRVTAKVRAIGNSLGIILPKKILENAGIEKGDTIEINIDLASQRFHETPQR
jgi:antitoxin component of MazEF toxin-antitoxin module